MFNGSNIFYNVFPSDSLESPYWNFVLPAVSQSFTKGCKQQYILDWLSISVECTQIIMVKYITVLKVSIETKISKPAVS